MRRAYLLLLTVCSCLIGAIVGVYFSIRLDADAPSLIAATAFPAVGAYLGGVRDRRLLAKIACYAFAGWFLCLVLLPPQIDVHFSAKSWHLFCTIPSTLLTVVAIIFAPAHLTRRGS